MKTYREIMYMIFDLLKIGNTDESQFTEDHLIALIDSHRAMLLKQRYTDVSKAIPMLNYQTIQVALDLRKGENGRGYSLYVGSETLPSIMTVGVVRTWAADSEEGYEDAKVYNHTPYNRLRFITKNKYNAKQVYTSIDNNGVGCLLGYFGDIPEQELSFTLSGLFECAKEVHLYNGIAEKDIIDSPVHIEERLVKDLISSIVAVLRESLFLPTDEVNNDRNELDNIPTK